MCIVLLLGFMLLALLPRTSEILTENAIDRTEETVLQSAGSVDIFVNGLLSTLNFTAASISDALGTGDDQWTRDLDYLKKSNSDITAVAVLEEDGTALYATGGEWNAAPATIAGEEWFQKALAWQGASTYFSAPHVQHLFGIQRNFVISLSRAVYYYGTDGVQRAGVVLMDVRYGAFSELIEDTRLAESGYVYILDENNQIIFHPRITMLDNGLAKEDATAAVQKVIGITGDHFGGRARTLIIESLSGTRWRMVGVAYFDEITYLLSDIRRIITVVILCAALISLIPASIIAYSVTRPILNLEHNMQKVEAGDLSVTIGAQGFTEIRAVSVAFNHMLARIRALMDQVVEEQEKKRLYELNALQAQINPHFLYNTLDSIIWMEERGRSREAITMVSALARLFRISISKGKNVISVREELEHVRNYLIIQKMRFKEKFIYEIEMEDAVKDARTIKLIIQPLVENAISHGFDQTSDDELRIRIRAYVQDDALMFSVSDDGVGMPAEQVERLLIMPPGKSGIGIRNVHERIQLTCGNEYGLRIESVEEEGTTVYVRLPREMKGPEQ
jgi:two-component system sensor histidine kinase YesM